jgi:hypothetical protein
VPSSCIRTEPWKARTIRAPTAAQPGYKIRMADLHRQAGQGLHWGLHSAALRAIFSA